MCFGPLSVKNYPNYILLSYGLSLLKVLLLVIVILFVSSFSCAFSIVAGVSRSSVVHGRTGHIIIGVAAGFPSCSMPSGGYRL